MTQSAKKVVQKEKKAKQKLISLSIPKERAVTLKFKF